MVVQERRQRLSTLECCFTKNEIELFLFRKSFTGNNFHLAIGQDIVGGNSAKFSSKKRIELFDSEKSVYIFFSCGLRNIFSLKENLAPIEALTEQTSDSLASSESLTRLNKLHLFWGFRKKTMRSTEFYWINRVSYERWHFGGEVRSSLTPTEVHKLLV